ncbi:hypothetical protein ACVIGB_000245 [Bradyrhizobium sp. USDA 4341]
MHCDGNVTERRTESGSRWPAQTTRIGKKFLFEVNDKNALFRPSARLAKLFISATDDPARVSRTPSPSLAKKVKVGDKPNCQAF